MNSSGIQVLISTLSTTTTKELARDTMAKEESHNGTTTGRLAKASLTMVARLMAKDRLASLAREPQTGQNGMIGMNGLIPPLSITMTGIGLMTMTGL